MDPLSIQSASAIQQLRMANLIIYAIAKKSQDIQKSQGQAAAALVQQAADVGKQIAAGYLDVEL